MEKRITAGTIRDIDAHKGEWLFIDLGFGEKAISCGVLKVMGQSDKVTYCKTVKYGEMVELVKQVARQDAGSTLSLVLEAPLSVTFNKDGNPVGRKCDVKNGEPREWYRYAAPPMILAAGYLLRELADCGIQRDVRLYEGFVSFKEPRSKTDHIADAKALKEAVWNITRHQMFDSVQLKRSKSDKIESAFKMMGMDFGIPPVIRL